MGVDIDVDCVAAAKRNAADNGFGGAEARFYLPEIDAGADAGAVAARADVQEALRCTSPLDARRGSPSLDVDPRLASS